MEKPPMKSKGNKLFQLLQKPASFSVPTHPFSPRSRRNDHSRLAHNKTFSGPFIPMEARRRSKDRNFDAKEPTSPKVSCIGQIKQKKADRSRRSSSRPSPPKKEKKPSFGLQWMFNRKVEPRKKEEVDLPPPAPAPALGQLKRFASGREGRLADFDWRMGGARVQDRRRSDSDEDSEDDAVIVPHSAPILIGGGVAAPEPKKEVNIWKRRTLEPLQVKVQ